MNLDPIFLSYLAGYVDADGCLHVAYRRPCFKQREISEGFSPVITIHITNIEIVEWFHSEVGMGSLMYYDPLKPRHKHTCKWQVSTQQAGYLCSVLYPYLHQKKEQALLIMEMCDIKLKSRRNGQFNKLRQREIYEEIRRLNKRGV